jgi:dipeptidyl aminopeptidase/acylaminoacyl peptidase
MLFPLGALALLFAPALSLFAQNPGRSAQGVASSTSAAAPLKPLNLEDYGRFNRIGGAALSSDGKWMTYSYTPLDGQGTAFIENLDAATKHTIERGSGVQISDNSRWAGYFIDPPRAGRGGGRGQGGGRANPPAGQAAAPATPPARTFELLDLQTGEKTSFPAVSSFSFSPDGDWLLIRPQNPSAAGATEAPAGRGGGGRGGRGGGAPAAGAAAGSDLIMYNPATKTQRYIGNVGQSSFDDSGKLFAYTIAGTQRLGNGVYVMTLASGEQKMLDAAVADYDQLTWSAEGTHLAVLRGDKSREKAYRDNSLLVWTNVGSPSQKAAVFDPSRATGFPKEMVVSEFAGLRFSEDGTRLWLGLKAQDVVWTPPAQAANVDVWHWNDPTPQSQQIIQVNQDRRSTMSAIYDMASNTIRQVADSAMRQVTPTSDLKWAVGRNDKPYRGEIAWGGSHGDYYRINLATGESKLIEKNLSRTHGFSPDDKYWMYQKDGHVFVYNMETGASQQIDGNKNFVNVQDDHDYEKPIYGVAGWAKDGKSVLLYDRYDVWQLPVPAGTPVNLTKGEGARQEITFRVQNYATPSAGGGGGGRGGRGGGGGANSEGLDLTKPLTLNGVGEWTKKEGYFDLNPGEAPKPIIFVDKNIGAPTVAKNADRMIFTQSTFNEFPDYWVADKRFNNPRKVTSANPFLGEYAWGTKKLIEYKNRFGQRLQATLTLPAGYEPGKKYPMLVYFYELMSNTHHNFSMPAYDDRPHISTYASNGYLVLQPDVVYEIGKPGTSAVDCVTAAVKEVIRQGYADPAHIGVQGHSWGGYQTSFMVTQTDMFAAIVTGAPPTDLTSFVGTTYPGSGTLQQGITEVGQVRMGKNRTPWNSHELYESQSPIHHVNQITTPFMILHGTADNAVDWHQGLEFYAAARRTGKNVILLSYPDEPHHLSRRENQLDFQVRMRQYFDHYLKGAPAPKWMTEGVPQVLKGREGLPIPGTQRATNTSSSGR